MAESQNKGKAFEEQVADLFALMGYEVHPNIGICGKEVDILAIYQIPGADTLHRIMVECKCEAKNTNQSARVREFRDLLDQARRENKAESAEVITLKPWGAEAKGLAFGSGVKLYTYRQKLAQLMNFDRHLQFLIDDFENDQLSKYYVDLNAEKIEKDKVDALSPIDSYLDKWIASETGNNRIALLGDYGTGKTSFCRHYAYQLAKDFLKEDQNRGRIPILFELGRFAKAIEFDDIIVGHLSRRCKIPNPSFDAFRAMNNAGLFLLIFDGFDEMAMRVDLQTMKVNIKKITELASARSKVFLTSRQEYFISEKEEEDVLAPEGHLTEAVKYERLNIMALDQPQIKVFLQKRIPLLERAEEDWTYYWKKINEIHDLSNLSERLVFLDMITRTLPQLIKEEKPVDRATLYQTYIVKALERQAVDQERRLLILPEDRFQFMQTLAKHFYEKGLRGQGMNALEIKNLIEDHLEPRQYETLEANLREFLTCSFLIRKGDRFDFSHLSIIEYLTAKGIIEEIQKDKPRVFRNMPLSKEVRDFLVGLKPNTQVLWRWIDSSRVKSPDEAEYGRGKKTSGEAAQGESDRRRRIEESRAEALERVRYQAGNAATILNLLGQDFRGKNFSHIVLHRADLADADLTDTNFIGAMLRNVNLSNATLKDADFTNAYFEQVNLEEVEEVHSVTFSSGGDFVASGGKDGVIRTWNIASGRRSNTLRGHKKRVLSMCYSPDGRFLTSGGEDKRIRIWSTKEGKEIKTIKGHSKPVNSVCYNPSDAGFIASGSEDKTIKIWEAASGKKVKTLKGHVRGVTSICYSPDGCFIVSGSRDRTVIIWDAETGEKKRVLRGHDGDILSVSYAKDGKSFASASWDGKIWIWEASSAEPIKILTSKKINAVKSVCFSGDGQAIISGGLDKEVTVWDIFSDQEPKRFKGHSNWINTLCLGPRGRYVASGDNDGTVRLWDLEPGKAVRTIQVRLDCEGMRITGLEGLEPYEISFLQRRGAITIGNPVP